MRKFITWIGLFIMGGGALQAECIPTGGEYYLNTYYVPHMGTQWVYDSQYQVECLIQGTCGSINGYMTVTVERQQTLTCFYASVYGYQYDPEDDNANCPDYEIHLSPVVINSYWVDSEITQEVYDECRPFALNYTIPTTFYV